jgi:tetratricopeptide (TPR) repeat protein
MAKVSLRLYNREIEGIIEHGQRLDEAIAHCRHILKTFPKYLETYRLLGKANLEAKHYNEAVDVFQRVLVAAPDDFVSHVGMSIIADDQGKLDEAIWHMERAFEVQPSNAAIQGELQRLFGRRDGVEPPKIRLTRGALAHMYVQGELYVQAISEIRAVLNNDSKRTDMQVLLAIAYFRNNQKAEAADICSELLTRFPYCLDANRLMIEILPGTQHADSVQEYNNRVNELDPYAAFAKDSLFHTETVADSAVSLDRLEYTGQSGDEKEVMGIGLASDATAIGRSLDQPKWLRPSSTPDVKSSFTSAPEAVSDSQPASPASGNDIPDFLRQAGWTDSTGEGQEGISSFNETGESESGTSTAVQGDLPDWVKALAPAEENEPSPKSFQTPAEAPVYSADTPDWLKNLGGDQPVSAAPSSEATPSEDTPDWIKNLGERELDTPAPSLKLPSEFDSQHPSSDWLNNLGAEPASTSGPGSSGDDSPDWLKEFDNDLETPIPKLDPFAQPAPEEPKSFSIHLEPEEPPVKAPESPSNLGSLGTTVQEQDDAMAWLEGLAAKHGAKPEELVTDPNARTEIAPEWVDKAKEINEQTPMIEKQPSSTTEDITGVWLRNLEQDESESLLPQNSTMDPTDWRTGLIGQNDLEKLTTEKENEGTPIMDASSAPDWLSDLGKPVPPPAIGDVPDWLHAPSTESAQPESPTTINASFESNSGGANSGLDLPDWLASLDKEEAPASQSEASTGDIPAWLQSEVEPEPQFTEPAHPADWQPIESKQPDQEPPDKETKILAEPVTQPSKPAPTPEQKIMTEAPSQPVKPVPIPEQKIIVEAPSQPLKSTPPPEQMIVEQRRPASAQAVRSKSTTASKAVVDSSSLPNAKTELGRGNIAVALDIYGKLIRKGRSLEEIIRDLRDALYRYPVEVSIWQALGDAYMRANRLQEALDSYTKAEELLR